MAEWVRAEVEFASLYSYRVPDLSPSFAVCSPLPGPATIRLALVDAVIRHTGSVEEGKAIFELVKRARLEIEPPARVAVMKFFLKRLKPEKPAKGKRGSVVESTGMREYCLPSGCMVLWMQAQDRARIAQAFGWLRRLGTTDSLASCKVGGGVPDTSVCLRPVNGLPLQADLAGRPVFTLHELTADAEFDQINPYARVRRGRPFEKRIYILPLVRERAGGNWVIYRRERFSQ